MTFLRFLVTFLRLLTRLTLFGFLFGFGVITSPIVGLLVRDLASEGNAVWLSILFDDTNDGFMLKEMFFDSVCETSALGLFDDALGVKDGNISLDGVLLGELEDSKD